MIAQAIVVSMAPAIETLLNALPRGRVALLLRHAERGPITDPKRSAEVPLTAVGLASARSLGGELGALLRDEPVIVAYSPVLRCEQTARELVAGLRARGAKARPAGPRGSLFGPYLRDQDAILAHATQPGADFFRDWFDGRVASGLIDSVESAARSMVGDAVTALGDARFVALVSHDWNVMLLREHLFGLRHEEIGGVGYLEGVALVTTQRGVLACYGDRVVDL